MLGGQNMEQNAQFIFNWMNILTTVLAITFFRFFIKRVTGLVVQKGRKPPTAAGGWPVIGHLPLLRGPELPHIKLSGLAEKYGPIFSIRLGSHPAVVINNWEAAKQCFTTHDIAVSSKPKFLSGKLMGYNYAMFVFSPYGSYWRKMRKITALELLSNRRLQLLTHAPESELNQAIKELYQIWKEGKKDGQGQVSVEMKRWFGDLIINLILGVVAGKRLFGVGAAVEEDDGVPFLRWLDVGGHMKAMKRISEVLDGLLTQWLEEHKKNQRAFGGMTKKADSDLMDVMLSDLEETGDDTTDTTTLGFDDRDTIVKATSLAVVKEAMRLYGAGSIIYREATKDLVIDKFHIEKGTWLLVNLWKIHRDGSVWAEPLEFKPERFLTTHKDFDVKGQQFELLFGGGRRACPGLSFGLQMVQFLLGGLLHAFDISTLEDAAVDMTGTIGMTNMKATPLEVLIKPRLSPVLYD